MQVDERALRLITLLGTEIVVDQTPRVGKRAVMQAPVAGIRAVDVTRRRIVFHGRVHVMSTLENMLVLARTHKTTIVDQQVNTAKANGVARRIEQAILDDNVARVETGNAVVARLERTGANGHVVAVMNVEAVMPAQDAHVLGQQVDARIHLMAPVSAALERIAPERHVLAAADADTHGAAKTLLARRIGAVDAVESATGLAGDRDVFRVGDGQQGTRIVRRKTLDAYDLGVGRVAQSGRDIPVGVIRDVVGALDRGTRLEIELGIPVHTDGTHAKRTGRDDDTRTLGIACLVEDLLELGRHAIVAVGELGGNMENSESHVGPFKSYAVVQSGVARPMNRSRHAISMGSCLMGKNEMGSIE